jgi:hypothetical protein
MVARAGGHAGGWGSARRREQLGGELAGEDLDDDVDVEQDGGLPEAA